MNHPAQTLIMAVSYRGYVAMIPTLIIASVLLGLSAKGASFARRYLELTKPRITLLILICAAVGYWFGCGASFHLTILAHALLGTALLASGTSALNQWYEVDSDAKMRRTRQRPLPAGRIKRGTRARLRPVTLGRRLC